VMPE